MCIRDSQDREQNQCRQNIEYPWARRAALKACQAVPPQAALLLTPAAFQGLSIASRNADLITADPAFRGDPNIGPRLPFLLTDGGFEKVDMTLVQPIGTKGEVKLLNSITLENIADAILQEGLASRQEIDTLVQELNCFAENPRTVAGVPRVIQAWGHRPAAS